MRVFLFVALFLAAVVHATSQSAPTPLADLPKDPRAVLDMAAPFYDFNDPTLKPWHLKATYQLYDEKGKPTEQGTYEYWWASPKVYRSTWARPSASKTDWHTAEGKHAFKYSGGSLGYYEFKLQDALFSPLPDPSELDPTKSRLDRELEPIFVGVKSPCVMVVPITPQHEQIQTAPAGLFPTYCFDTKLPILRASFSWTSVSMEFSHIAKVQGKFLPEEIVFLDGKRTILSAKVDKVEGLNPTDAALVPPPDAKTPSRDKVFISAGVAVGFITTKQAPVYPQDAKDAGIAGTVVLQAVIGRDGNIHDLRIISTPWPSLAAASLSAVSHWQYKPYLLNGEPVEVETTINVIFTLGR